MGEKHKINEVPQGVGRNEEARARCAPEGGRALDGQEAGLEETRDMGS